MSTQLLLVEDNPADVLFLQGALSSRYPGEYATTVASSLGEADSLLGRQAFDAALLDLSLPDSRGLETIGRLAAAEPRLPIVVFTGVADASLVPKAMHCGAQDYLLKGRSDGETIAQAIHYAIDRKRDEEDLREARSELVTRVQPRNERLAASIAELVQAKDAAIAASRAKSALLANISHEMRKPLSTIIGLTQQLLKDEFTSRQREFLSIVDHSAEMLLGLTENMLDLASIDAGTFTLTTATFDLRQRLAETMQFYAARAQLQRLPLIWEIQPDVPRLVNGDWARLRQILASLLDNALKFTERGEVGLELKMESLSKRDARLHFVVRDTGIGVPEDRRATIFRAFEQAGASSAGPGGKLGLGLAIASRLISLMDGRLWLESEVGRGSRFHFTVRLGLAPATAAQP